jgi:hypothetical protein
MSVQFEEMFLQHDGASLHAANAILDALNENSGNCIILNHLSQYPFLCIAFATILSQS